MRPLGAIDPCPQTDTVRTDDFRIVITQDSLG